MSGDHDHHHDDDMPAPSGDVLAQIAALKLSDVNGTPFKDHGTASESLMHQQVFNLVKYSDATSWAIRDGEWSDPDTWLDGKVPGDGAKVVILKGVEVEYDAVSDARLFTVRVDGELHFATDHDTRMVIDTLVTAGGSTLTIGTKDDPVQAGVKTEIVIADDGPIDRVWDPAQLSRGVVTHGTVRMFGEEKTVHLEVKTDPKAGDTSITLAEAPQNWHAGDTIVLTGTHYVPKSYDVATGKYDTYNGTEDEVLTVKSVTGNTVTFEQALKFNHDTPAADLKASVANYSRNIEISTEHADTVPTNQRGHTMFMHTDDVDVEYVEFHELGRTDKSKPLDNYVIAYDPDGFEYRIKDASGQNYLKGEEDNIRGRYAVHFHRTGDTIDDTPAMAVGNSVWGSPGWGYVQHDAYAILKDNAAYDVYGSAFAAETGNETGAWIDNIAIKGEGRETGSIKFGVNDHDLGAEGHGFWFTGRLLDVEGNVAAGQSYGGFTWMSRGIDILDSKAVNLPFDEVARYHATVGSDTPEFQSVTDNETMASRRGLESMRLGVQQYADDRSYMDGFKAWEVVEGVVLQYTSAYTFENVELYGTRKTSDVYKTQLTQNLHMIGIDLEANTQDMVFRGLLVDGFKTGVFSTKDITSNLLAAGAVVPSDFGFRFIDATFSNNFEQKGGKISSSEFMSSASLFGGPLALHLDDASLVAKPADVASGFAGGVVLKGTKTDGLGTVSFPDSNEHPGFTVDEVNASMATRGYWTLTDGTRVIILQEVYADRLVNHTEVHEFLVRLDPAWKIPDTVPSNGAYAHDRSGDVYVPAALVARIGSTYDSAGGTPAFNGSPVADSITGSHHADLMYGGAGNDTLIGGEGADTMIGGTGDDTYDVRDAGDVVQELAGQGNDTVKAYIAYVLGAQVENLFVMGTALAGTGNDLANRIVGNALANTLMGMDGDDVLEGGAGNDTLIGGSGCDTMMGGTGDDTYEVNDGGNGTSRKDLVVEKPGEGIDTVRTSIDYALRDNVENLVLLGDHRVIGTGNALANVITANDAGCSLAGGDGNDTLIGGLGSDTLNGGAGQDRMVGGKGNDLYIVTETGNPIFENADEGTDTVQSSITYVIGANIERLVLVGTADLQGGGNALDNMIIGNQGNNALSGFDGNDILESFGGNDRLIGGRGDDVMKGRGGNDYYSVDSIKDKVIEVAGEGIDTIDSTVTYTLSANVEKLVLSGTANINGFGNELDNSIIGNAGANLISGGAGNDTIEGGAGNDTLTGGAGRDFFIIRATDITASSPTNRDTITDLDFSVRDTLQFRNFAGLSAFDAGVSAQSQMNALWTTLSNDGRSETSVSKVGQDVVMTLLDTNAHVHELTLKGFGAQYDSWHH